MHQYDQLSSLRFPTFLIELNFLYRLLMREREKPKIPWKKLIKLTKETRKERMKEIYANVVIPDELRRQRYLVLIIPLKL